MNKCTKPAKGLRIFVVDEIICDEGFDLVSESQRDHSTILWAPPGPRHVLRPAPQHFFGGMR